MPDYLTKTAITPVPQTEKADPRQVANSAGGYTFQLNPLGRLQRFLIIGSEGGSYYVGERDLTKQNLNNLKSLIDTQPNEVVDMVVEISQQGRALRNNTAIFVLAYVMTFGSDDAKSYARQNVNLVVRTSTHLFTFNNYLKALAPGSGLGTSRNRAIAAWYEGKTTDQIAYQAVKYRQREGWTHRDALRQSRPKGIDTNLGNWILDKPVDGTLPDVIRGFNFIQQAHSIGDVLNILEDYPILPWEAIPTQFLKSPELWKKLFYNGQLEGQALVRNITRLARMGAFDDLVFARDYAAKLTDEEMIRKTRLHPLNLLNALVVHTEGQIRRGDSRYSSMYAGREKNWVESNIIVDALNDGVHLAFKHVEPAGKRTLLAVDVSGSMSAAVGMGLDLSAAQISGVMAATLARTEPYTQIMGFANEFRDLGITGNMPLNTVMTKVRDNNFGSTDCSLPMVWAAKRNAVFDTFVVITDNETYAGREHPHVALKNYRRQTGLDAKLIVVGVTATDFSIADPSDAGMLDVIGADANLPKLIAEFSAGRI